MAEPNEPVGPGPGPDAEPKPSEEAEGSPQFTVVDRRFWAAHEKEGNGEPSGVEPSTSRVPTFVARLQEQLEEKDRVLRTHVAELRTQHEELRRRLARELEQRVELATGNMLADFLPLLDNLERALSAAEQRPQLETLLEGIRLVQGQFVSILGRYGLKPLARQGQPFDPSLDEAMTTLEVEDPGQTNLVLQEWEKGYTLHDKILRPAKVVVGKLGAEDR
jgi:molecular chaperone GrpE